MTDEFEIRTDDLSDERVQGLVRAHLEGVTTKTPEGCVFALGIEALRAPDVTFYSVWDGDHVVGCGALRELDPTHGEIKSMRTTRSHLRRGIGARIVEHILEEAKMRSYTRVSLETGASEAFAAARALYSRLGFETCGKFGDYTGGPFSVFMTIELDV